MSRNHSPTRERGAPSPFTGLPTSRTHARTHAGVEVTITTLTLLKAGKLRAASLNKLLRGRVDPCYRSLANTMEKDAGSRGFWGVAFKWTHSKSHCWYFNHIDPQHRPKPRSRYWSQKFSLGCCDSHAQEEGRISDRGFIFLVTPADVETPLRPATAAESWTTLIRVVVHPSIRTLPNPFSALVVDAQLCRVLTPPFDVSTDRRPFQTYYTSPLLPSFQLRYAASSTAGYSYEYEDYGRGCDSVTYRFSVGGPCKPRVEPMRVIEVSVEQCRDERGKREIPEKTRRPTESFGTIPRCENL
ncbi:hypothetical protein PR048_008531 [Dryococelus australis]|uniref:Uncharacterized protein n=1 Tax=Dryococelus australis TaxID=614101 RepID=A0ABQ9HXC9_9NEOP|nr:hypothetical protein PR048_008531 [Dryococelus australis]